MEQFIVGAVVAVIAGALSWFVALRSADFGRRTALEIWEREQHAREHALRRALRAEIVANIAATRDPDRSAISTVQRSAWDSARTLTLPDAVFEAVNAAYVTGDGFNGAVARLDATMARGTNTAEQQNDMVKNARNLSALFQKALDALDGKAIT